MEYPQKKLYRQRAHCNPLSDSLILYPPTPRHVDWFKRYPKDNSIEYLGFNTREYPEDYSTNLESDDYPKVTILDIGCGYGGLLIYLSKLYPNDYILGMEIRDKVTNYVGKRILSLRQQHPKEYLNISVVRTNIMKFITNYIDKDQIDKMFFCFPDPHFKRSNWRRRIINYSLLSVYSYLLKKNGRIYIVTDVFELYTWMINALEEHPSFKIMESSELENDECYNNFHKVTEEGIKNEKINNEIYKSVYYRV